MRRLDTFDEIEIAVLSAVMAFPERALTLVPDLEVTDFGDGFRRAAFTAVRTLEAAGQPIHALAVADSMFAAWQLANDGKCTVFDECRIVCGLGLIHTGAERYGEEDHEIARLLPRHARALRTIRYAREERMHG